MPLHKYLLAMLLSLAAAAVSAATTDITLNNPLTQKMSLKDYLYYWVGDENISPEELSKSVHFFALWQPVEAGTHISVWQTTPVRLKFYLRNHAKAEQQLVMVYPQTTLDEIRVTYLENDVPIKKYRSGNQLPFNARPINHRQFVFPVTLKPDQEITVLIEANGRLDRILDDLSLWPRQVFFERTDTELLFNALFFGVLLVFSIYSFLLFSAVRETSYLWFSLYTLCLLVRELALENIPFEFLWPFMPVMQNFTLILSVTTSTALNALFIMAYLQIRPDTTPKLYKVYLLYLVAHAAIFIYQAFTGWSLTSINIWLIVAGPFNVFIWFNALYLHRKKHANAGPFLIAFSCLLFGALITILDLFVGFPMPLPQAANTGQLIYIAIISIALSMHIGKARAKAHMIYAENKAKSDFMAKMSHEIRTPINGVLGMAQLLSSTELSNKQKHYADVINHCGKTLLNVINDILEYAKIEAGKLELENQSFNLDQLLLKNNTIFWPQIQNKGLHYHYQLDPKVPHHLIGDPERLQQILNNLFSNAVKFTSKGSIHFLVNLLFLENEEFAHLEFRISDDGIGMSSEELENLFTPFSQANGTSRHYGGSGLGLNISKQLISLMGGEITVESRLGSGTEFRILIPFKIDLEQEAQRIHENSQLHHKRVMSLAESSSQQSFAAQLLSNWGMKVKTFTDFHDAEAYMQEDVDGFDLILVSHSVLQHLSPVERSHLKQQISKALFYDCQYKEQVTNIPGFEQAQVALAPLSHEQVRQKVFKLLGLTPAAKVEAICPEQLKKREDLRVLVAEDDATNRLVIRAVLKQMNIKHDIVINGLLALERYQQSPESYDVILMDCEMPEMDGYQASDKIRELEKQKKLRAVPIIALTAHVLPEYEHRCYESGINKVLAKPIDLQVLTETLDAISHH